jgi:hypothetical protein
LALPSVESGVDVAATNRLWGYLGCLGVVVVVAVLLPLVVWLSAKVWTLALWQINELMKVLYA